MSTRANYVFYNGRTKIGNIYIHHDNYREGAAVYLHRAMIQGRGRVTLDGFYQANIKNAQWSMQNHGDIEYLYKINVKTQKVRVDNLRGYCETHTIPAFINKYFTVFHNDSNYEKYMLENKFSLYTTEQLETRVKREAVWIPRSFRNNKTRYVCLELLYNELQDLTKQLCKKAYNYKYDNPNIVNLVADINATQIAIETLIMGEN